VEGNIIKGVIPEEETEWERFVASLEVLIGHPLKSNTVLFIDRYVKNAVEPLFDYVELLKEKVASLGTELGQAKESWQNCVSERDELQGQVDAHESHVYHHQDATPVVHVKVERNSRSINWEASVTVVGSPDEAISLLGKTTDSLRRTYGDNQAASGTTS